jgi:MtN3 and saliva related transmembrane protein
MRVPLSWSRHMGYSRIGRAMPERMMRSVRNGFASSAMLVCLALPIVAAAPPAAKAQESTKHFDIMEQPLLETSMAFGLQTGVIVVASSGPTTGEMHSSATGGVDSGKLREVVSWLFGVGLVCNALLFVPQAISIWRRRSAAGISLLSFSGFNLVQFIGVLHGWMERDWSLLLGMLASFLTCGTVTSLTLWLRGRDGKRS